MTTATFSNGHADTYKGHRPVKAAWAIFRQDGSCMASGHSLDRTKAEKTANTNLRHMTGGLVDTRYAFGNGRARPLTYWEARNAREHNARTLEAARKRIRIEIVDL